MKEPIPIQITNRQRTVSLTCPSIRSAAKVLEVNIKTVINRMMDGLPIVKEGCNGLYVDIAEEK